MANNGRRSSPLPTSPILSVGSKDRALSGMKGVVATVSGYHGPQRFNLIKLIDSTGASFVGSLTRSNTHLVCYKFEGRKYDFARKFNTVIVNHKWIEDCVRAGKRIPEDPYKLLSGVQVGPLSLELPLLAKKENVSSRMDGLSSCQPKTCSKSRFSTIDVGCEASPRSTSIDSISWEENLFPELGTGNNDFGIVMKKRVTKASKQSCWPSNRYNFHELPSSELVTVEREDWSSDLVADLARQKRIMSNDLKSTTFSRPSHKRRLVKAKVNRAILDSTLANPQQECFPRVFQELDNISGSESVENEGLDHERTSFHVLSHKRRLGKVKASGGILNSTLNNPHQEYIPRPFQACDSISTSDSVENESMSGIFYDCGGGKNEGLEAENINRQMKDGSALEHSRSLPISSELSCVICWTDFSSIRGILPCGHRFCYSCIQSWADCMVSRGKVSSCPLCKASFVSITKVGEASSSDQKIYSQTIPPSTSKMDVFILNDAETSNFRAQTLLAPVCCNCGSEEPVDLLIPCRLCQTQCIHSYCLDPPLLPWTCNHCKDLRRLY